MSNLKEIKFPALGEFLETIMKRKGIKRDAFCSEEHVSGYVYTHLKKGII